MGGRNVPDIKRSYTDIELRGSKINKTGLKNILTSSRFTAKRLIIGGEAEDQICKIAPKTLCWILRSLPYLEEVTVEHCKQISTSQSVTSADYPKLKMLKSLVLRDAEFLDCFVKAKHLEKLSIEDVSIESDDDEISDRYVEFIEKQKRLVELLLYVHGPFYWNNGLPELKSLDISFCCFDEYYIEGLNCELINLSPKLEKLQLKFLSDGEHTTLSFLSNHASRSLKHIDTNEAICSDCFAFGIIPLLYNYPALETYSSGVCELQRV